MKYQKPLMIAVIVTGIFTTTTSLAEPGMVPPDEKYSYEEIASCVSSVATFDNYVKSLGPAMTALLGRYHPCEVEKIIISAGIERANKILFMDKGVVERMEREKKRMERGE